MVKCITAVYQLLLLVLFFLMSHTYDTTNDDYKKHC